MKEIRLKDLPANPEIQKAILQARKMVVLVGAGISTSGGVQDFRGARGLYTKDKTSMQDLFDALHVFSTEEKTRKFYSFMGELSGAVEAARPTATHKFLKELDSHGKLLRVYSQNIDYLEERAGIPTGIDKSSRVIPLHGTLKEVSCRMPNCRHTEALTSKIREEFASGEAPPCPNCVEMNEVKSAVNKRVGRGGSLRPRIILYNETHPQGSQIAEIMLSDARRKPDLLIIMGTSLKIPGCKDLIRSLGKVIHEKKGLVIFINDKAVSSSEWDSLIDFHISCKTDSFSKKMQPRVDEHETEKEQRKRKRIEKGILFIFFSLFCDVTGK